MGLTSFLIPITSADSSQVGQARRQASLLSSSIGFNDVRAGELSIVVTEAARNIAAHAGEGQIVLSPWSMDGTVGIDVFALDRGPGIADISKAYEDGFSTAGTPGHGLGAMSRLAATLQIYSTPVAGTALFARVIRESGQRDSQNTPNSSDEFPFGAISVPITGESVCGDAWSSSHSGERSIYIVADGLGHGPLACEAAQEAVRIFHTVTESAPDRILKEIHGALGKTRGAAVSVAEIRHRDSVLHYAGAGNICAAIYSGGKSRSLVSMNGTVGHSVAKLQQFSYPWERNSTLIMHSDGLTTRWNVEQYSGLASRHPALLAGVLYRDFCRGRDDATVLVSRR